MTSPDHVEHALHRARLARLEGRSAVDALEEARGLARSLPPDQPLRAVVAYKLSKALFDAGALDAALDAILPHLEPEAFEAYPYTPHALGSLARAYQDRFGYGGPTLGIWQALERHHLAIGDRYLAAIDRLQLVWDAAVAGDAERLHREARPLHVLSPEDLAGGASHHPDADDAQGSLPWLTLDLAHAELRAEIWSASPRAPDALSAVLDALEDVPHPPPHIAESLEEARFHGLDVPSFPHAPALDGFTTQLVAAFSRGGPFLPLVDRAPTPEQRWATVLAAVRSGECGPERLLESAETGCGAFAQAAERLRTRR